MMTKYIYLEDEMNTNKDYLIYMKTSTLINKDRDSVRRQKSSMMKWVKSNVYSVKGDYWGSVLIHGELIT